MKDYRKIAKKVFSIESACILDLQEKLGEDFDALIEEILNLKGRLVITGMGKSGHIGAKIAATLASTGTPSFFMHPGEALHGDLGMLTQEDMLLAISNSGESEEVLRLIPSIKRRGIKLISMSGKKDSHLAKEGDYFLNIFVKKEACPLQLAPTSSTTASLVMGDAIAVALMEARGFKAKDFALFHPGGSLGKKLLTRVKDIMIKKNLPIVSLNTDFKTLITEMTSKRLGMCLVVENGSCAGIITDGDLRRALLKDEKSRFEFSAQEIMTKNPQFIDENAMASEAESLMFSKNIKELVVKSEEKIVGVIQLYAIGNM